MRKVALFLYSPVSFFYFFPKSGVLQPTLKLFVAFPPRRSFLRIENFSSSLGWSDLPTFISHGLVSVVTGNLPHSAVETVSRNARSHGGGKLLLYSRCRDVMEVITMPDRDS